MKTLFNAVRALAAAACLCTAGSAAAAHSDYYLKIEGVDGESATVHHKGWIEIMSCDFSVARPPDGSAPLSSLSFAKKTDKSSATLMQACATGQHFPRATLDVLEQGRPRNARYYEIVLEDLLISSFQSSGSGGGAGGSSVPVEQFSINFARIKCVFRPLFVDGSQGDGVQMMWDLIQGTAAASAVPPFRATMGPGPQGGTVITWLAEAGRKYQARTSLSLTGEWLNAGPEITGNGLEMRVPLPPGGSRLFVMVEEIP